MQNIGWLVAQERWLQVNQSAGGGAVGIGNLADGTMRAGTVCRSIAPNPVHVNIDFHAEIGAALADRIA